MEKFTLDANYKEDVADYSDKFIGDHQIKNIIQEISNHEKKHVSLRGGLLRQARRLMN